MVGFIQETIPTQRPIVPLDFTHALCTGQTGSGKTSGFILPNIDDRIARGHGLLVVDFKGNLGLQVKALARRRGRLEAVHEVGVPWGTPIEPLAGLDRGLFIQAIESLIHSRRDLWDVAAVGLALRLFDLLDALEDIEAFADTFVSEPSVGGLRVGTFLEAVESPQALRAFCLRCREFLASSEPDPFDVDPLDTTDPAQAPIYEELAAEARRHLDYLENFVDEIDEDSPAAGNGGVLFGLRSLLQHFTPFLRSDGNDLFDMLESGRILILRSDIFSEPVSRMLMQTLFLRLSRRLGQTPVSLFVDEFQRVVAQGRVPFVDLFREKRVELIAAVQNIDQLRLRIGEETEAFLGNVIHRYAFADRRENDLEPFGYRDGRTLRRCDPIFLDEEELLEAQVAWQRTRRIRLSLKGRWAILQPRRGRRCLVQELGTRKRREIYVSSATAHHTPRPFIA